MDAVIFSLNWAILRQIFLGSFLRNTHLRIFTNSENTFCYTAPESAGSWPGYFYATHCSLSFHHFLGPFSGNILKLNPCFWAVLLHIDASILDPFGKYFKSVNLTIDRSYFTELLPETAACVDLSDRLNTQFPVSRGHMFLSSRYYVVLI